MQIEGWDRLIEIGVGGQRQDQESWNTSTLVICTTQLTGGISFKKLKYFGIILNIFEFSHVWEIAELWFVFVNAFS